MTRLRSVTTCILVAGALSACTTTRAPIDPQNPSDDGFRGTADKLLHDLSTFGAPIYSVGDVIMLRSLDGDDAACTNPPRPNTPRGLALAALMRIHTDQEAGVTTTIERCRPKK
jgi:hypothetical protein